MAYNHDEVYRVGAAPTPYDPDVSGQGPSSHRRGPSIDNKTFAVPSRRNSTDDDLQATTTTSSLSSYAGSAESYDDEEFSPVDYLTDTITSIMDPSKLDRVVVVQAQT